VFLESPEKVPFETEAHLQIFILCALQINLGSGHLWAKSAWI
jgi:hypothetical protein